MMAKKYHVDFTSLVVDHRTYEKLNSDKFQYSNRKEFIKRLVDDDVIEIVNIEEADEDVSLTYPKEDRDEWKRIYQMAR